MYHREQAQWIWRARIAALLCAILVSSAAFGATSRLHSIDVAPVAASINVGQTQAFTATVCSCALVPHPPATADHP